MKIIISKIFFFLFLIKCFAFSQETILVRELISPIVPNFDCYSPSIAEVTPGILCAVWKGGPGQGKSNIDMTENVGLWIAHYEKGHWSTPKQIVAAPKTICWNPVLCQHFGTLLLFYRVGPNPRNVVALLKRSYDGGETWTGEEILPAGILGPTKAKPYIDAEGNLLYGSSIECGEPTDLFKATACWIEVSDPAVKTWKKYGPIEIPGQRFGAIEPSLVKDNYGNLRLFCRDRAAKIGRQGWIWSGVSFDEGKTWNELTATSLPNPDSGIEAIDLEDGRILMIYNSSHQDRFPLRLAVSEDGGDSWQIAMILEEDSGEMPSAILDSEGLLHIVYAWTPPYQSQRCIKHIAIDPSKLCLNGGKLND
jgi:predicted neuraminidase